MTGRGDQENETCLFPVTAVNITGGPDGAVNRWRIENCVIFVYIMLYRFIKHTSFRCGKG